MATIVLRNFDKLVVSDLEAERVNNDKKKANELSLVMPYTITHEDGLWVGTLNDIGPRTMSEKSQPTHFLKPQDIERFHKTHGYGKYQSKYEPGYGYLDVQTQYILGTGQGKLVEDGNRKFLVLIPSEYGLKWSELWQDYLTKLDPFNELK